MPVRFANAAVAGNRDPSVPEIAGNPTVRAALEWLANNVGVGERAANSSYGNSRPAVSGTEQRALAVKALVASFGLRVEIDETGNVIGELRGQNENEIVMLAAHLDTVFPSGTDVKVHRENERLIAPGISDNGAGLSGMVALARAMHESQILPQRTILLIADVGEEGEGNFRGMRAGGGSVSRETESGGGAGWRRNRSCDDESAGVAPRGSGDQRSGRTQLVGLRHA